jgi:hypothetical protein
MVKMAVLVMDFEMRVREVMSENWRLERRVHRKETGLK